ncbi:hypothetical protein ACF0H5_003215 [Mactra antiquata]
MDVDWGLNNAELLTTIATLQWSEHNDPSWFDKLATFRIGYEVYQRFSGNREVDALRAQTIAAIVKYVKDNPKAKKEDLQKEISKHIFAFAHKVENM